MLLIDHVITRFIALMIVFAFMAACGSSSVNLKSIEPITDPARQDSVFRQLVSLTSHEISENELKDSLAFLVLPLEASCPSCRNKTIDSIVKHKRNITKDHFIILSASGGTKTINSYFIEQGEELPEIENQLFLDTTLAGYKYDLYKDNPVIYYTSNRKAFKKVTVIPATVRNDLHLFFSGKHTHKN